MFDFIKVVFFSLCQFKKNCRRIYNLLSKQFCVCGFIDHLIETITVHHVFLTVSVTISMIRSNLETTNSLAYVCEPRRGYFNHREISVNPCKSTLIHKKTNPWETYC